MSVFQPRNCHPSDHRYQLYQQLTQSPINETAILSLVQSRPKLCELKYEFPHPYYKKKKMTVFPLSRLVCFQPSLSLVQLVHKIHPEAIEEKDESERLPLHYACRLSASKEVVHYLITEYPEAVGAITNQGNYPFHIACANFQPLEIIQELFESGEQQIVKAVNNYDRWTPLHFATRHKAAPGVIPYLLEIYPDAAKARDHLKRLPLHHACWTCKPLVEIEALVSVFPASVECTNGKDQLPLHVACQRQNSIDVVHYLVVCYPEGVAVQSSEAKVPIDLAMENEASDDIVIQFLGAVANDLEKLVSLTVEKRKELLDGILEKVLSETAQAAPEVSSDSLTPSDENKEDSENNHCQHATSGKGKANEPMDSDTPDDAHQTHESAEDAVRTETPSVNRSASPRRNGARTTIPPISTVPIGAVWVRGPDHSDTQSDGNDSLSQESTTPLPISSTDSVVTKTPIASEIAPRLAELEAELEDYKRRFGEGDVVEADEVIPTVHQNQVSIPSDHQDQASTKCCTIM